MHTIPEGAFTPSWTAVSGASRLESGRPVEPADVLLSRAAVPTSPIEFQSQLHATRIIILSIHDAEAVAVEVGGGGAELHSVERIENLPAEVQLEPLGEGEPLRQADVLVEGRETTDLGVESSRVPESDRLRWKRGRAQEAVNRRVELVPANRPTPIFITGYYRPSRGVRDGQRVVARD